MLMREHYLRPSIHFVLRTSFAIILATQSISAANFDCDGLLRMHGLLRNAARVCGFSRYNEAVVGRAHNCFDLLGKAQGALNLYQGADEFAALIASQGGERTCALLLKLFPTVVRP